MNAGALTLSAGKSVKQDPAGALKVLFFLALAILVIYVLYKFLKGIGKAGELISEFGPSTEAEKLETIGNPDYQEGIKWLGDRIGIETLVKKGFTKNAVSVYLNKIGFPFEHLTKAAETIWAAKWPGYISETEVDNAIASLPSRVTVSLMAMEFNRLYAAKWNGSDLATFLGKYLKLSEMNTLTSLIVKKPIV